jgi:hypothetical protein
MPINSVVAPSWSAFMRDGADPDMLSEIRRVRGTL